MGSEMHRLAEFVQSCESVQGGSHLCDGGIPVAGLAGELPRDEMFRLLSAFCGPQAAWAQD